MEAPPFLAHISDDGRTQTVLAHLQGTAALAKKFAGTFGGGSASRIGVIGSRHWKIYLGISETVIR